MPNWCDVTRRLLFVCFAWLLLATGFAGVEAGAVQGQPAELIAQAGALEDTEPSLDSDPFDDTAVDPVHPWDNNDFSDTLATDDPGRLRIRPVGTPLHAPTLDTVEAMRSSAVVPTEVRTISNYPNPFNAQTRIEFHLVTAGVVRLEIYNLLGQMVQRVDWRGLPVGRHAWTWDGKDLAHRPVPSGVYFARLEVGGSSTLHKMVLLK